MCAKMCISINNIIRTTSRKLNGFICYKCVLKIIEGYAIKAFIFIVAKNSIIIKCFVQTKCDFRILHNCIKFCTTYRKTFIEFGQNKT